MNHKIGDIITIADYATICARTIIEGNYRFYDKAFAYFTNDMKELCQQSFEIRGINPHGYDVTGARYTFSDYMLTSFDTAEEQPYEFW